MSILQIDISEEQPKIEVKPSIIIEVVSFVNLLANREKYDFEKELVNRVYEKLSSRSRRFVELVKGMSFSGCDLIGFFMSEEIYFDFDLFMEKVLDYSGTEFIYRAFDREFTVERLEEVKGDRNRFQDFLDSVASLMWKTNARQIEALLYDTEKYKEGLVGLVREIYGNEDFRNKVSGLTEVYRQSIEDVRQRLLIKSPIELVKEIKGWSKSIDSKFEQYYFFPTYFIYNHNIISWYDKTFTLFYNAKFVEKVNSKEVDTVLSIFKSLSDKTRLQILQLLRIEPLYGKQLAERLNLSGATISRHLDQLKSLNLVAEEKSDNYKYFRLNKEEIGNIVDRIQTFLSSN